MNTECWTSSHAVILLLGILGSLVWVAGLLLFLFRLLGQDLSRGEAQKEFSFLFEKYQPKHRRWEIFRELQKICLVAVKVLISERFQPGKNFTLLVMLGLLILVEGKVGPFLTERLNRLNLFSFAVVYLTVVIELIFSEVESEWILNLRFWCENTDGNSFSSDEYCLCSLAVPVLSPLIHCLLRS